MIMETPEQRASLAPGRGVLEEDFLFIKGYLVPRELLSRQPEQAVDLGWLEDCSADL